MLALLHGRVPDDWSPCYDYCSTMSRKWKKRKHTSDGKDSGDAAVPAATAAVSSTGVKILPLQRSGVSPGISLSTVCIETGFPSAATVCHMMRKLGYPVVGDTNCRREYLELKRSIRNRIKNRICLVSYQVSFKDFNSETTIQVPRTLPPIPDKLSAEHWETNFGSGSASTVE
jgi:23S rRNA-/tRNA-specific pseudouridylate synthase